MSLKKWASGDGVFVSRLRSIFRGDQQAFIQRPECRFNVLQTGGMV
jgi:hypothetical protein